MTLDILSFIDTKGGNSAEIKESQKKRGLSVELVDEIIQMYADWVKSKFLSRRVVFSLIYVCVLFLIYSGLRYKCVTKKSKWSTKGNIGEEKGNGHWFDLICTDDGFDQAKQSADDLVATKKEIDAQVEEKKKEAREFEIKMRQKASTVGNIVGKNVPVSLTEVSRPFYLTGRCSFVMEGR